MANAVHRDPVVIESGEQGADFDTLVAKYVEGPGAIFARTPGEQHFVQSPSRWPIDSAPTGFPAFPSYGWPNGSRQRARHSIGSGSARSRRDVFGAAEGNAHALRPPADGAANVQLGIQTAATRQDERS